MTSRRSRLLLALAAPALLALAALAAPSPADPPVCPICGGSFEEFVARFEATVDTAARILVHALVR